MLLPLLSSATTFMHGKSADIARTATVIGLQSTIIDAIKAKRNDASFAELFPEVSSFCRSREMPVPSDNAVSLSEDGTVLPPTRRRQPPKALTDFHVISSAGSGSVDADSLTTKSGCRREMFAIIDRIVSELDERFSANAMQLIPKQSELLEF